MKKTTFILAITAIACATLSIPAQSAEMTKPSSQYEGYTCDKLTTLGFESVGPVVYYVRGHYDAKHDTWTEYGIKSKSKTADVGIETIPVEDVYTYCLQNPKDTVVNAINKQKK